tara:strand:+ start:186 stop:617 length:432 start_codon:yes stop_codon:yes gene_type:complete
MASELKVNTLTGVSTAGSIAVTAEGNSTTTNLQQGLAKAWVNFDHTAIDGSTDTTGVRDSFNIGSVVDIATGRATTNLSNPMSDADHISTGSAGDASQSAGRNLYVDDGGGNTASAIVTNIENNSSSVSDAEYVALVTHGSLA